jgi:hypothetical protein
MRGLSLKGSLSCLGGLRESGEVDPGFSFEWGGYTKEVDFGSRLRS